MENQNCMRCLFSGKLYLHNVTINVRVKLKQIDKTVKTQNYLR